VAVAGLSAYGLWRHTSREESEAPSELDPLQQEGEDGTRHQVVYGIQQSDQKYYGDGTDTSDTAALDFLKTGGWIDLQVSSETGSVTFAGASISKAELSRKTGLEIMQAVNAFAAQDDTRTGPLPYNFDKALPKLVVPREAFPSDAAAEADPAAC
jgi:hypothetical protein